MAPYITVLPTIMFSCVLPRKSGLGLMMMRPPDKPLADVVVTFASQFQRHALGQECTEALAGRSGQFDVNGVIRQTGVTITAGDFARQHGATGAIDVDDRGFDLDLLALFERRLGLLDQLVIKRLAQAVILFFSLATRLMGWHVRLIKDLRKIQTLGFPVIDTRTHIEQIGTTDQIFKLADTQLAMISRTSSATKKK
jgi:hypothetical protein